MTQDELAERAYQDRAAEEAYNSLQLSTDHEARFLELAALPAVKEA